MTYEEALALFAELLGPFLRYAKIYVVLTTAIFFAILGVVIRNFLTIRKSNKRGRGR